MTFFGFNDFDNTAMVNEVTQLNENWDKVDTRLSQFQSDNAAVDVTSPPVGTEILDGVENDVVVWTGTEWRYPDFISAGWSAWTDIPLMAPVVERPGFTPRFRVNTIIRRVMLSGGLRYDVGANPWPTSKVQISDNAGAHISSIYKPVYSSIQYAAASAGTVAGEVMGARIFIEDTGAATVTISVEQQGNDGGGNFVVLDDIKWWY